MSSRSLQPVRRSRAAFHLAAVCLVPLALGGCLGRGTTDVATTGSIGEAAAPDRASIEALGQAYDRAPDDPAAAMAYAKALKGIGQNQQAVAVLQQAAIRHSRDQVLLAAYGKALAEAGRLREAASTLAKAHTPERPDWRILSAQGAVADQLGDFAGAQRYYEAALRLAPGEPSVLSNQGLSFALAKRLPEAESVLRQAAASPGADARVRQNLALVLSLQGKNTDGLGSAGAAATSAEPPRAKTALREVQPNSWRALKALDAAATRPAPTPPALAKQAALADAPSAPTPSNPPGSAPLD